MLRKRYDTWCLSVFTDIPEILNIPDISYSPFLFYYNCAITLGKRVLIKTPTKLENYAPAIHGKGRFKNHLSI